jgi:hypothetical protein
MSETGGYTSIGVWLSYNYLPVVLKTQLEMTIRSAHQCQMLPFEGDVRFISAPVSQKG